MNVYYCKQCRNAAETSSPHGEVGKCDQCGTPVRRYEALFFLKNIINEYFNIKQQLTPTART